MQDYSKNQEANSLTFIPDVEHMQNVFKSLSLQDIKLMEEASPHSNLLSKRSIECINLASIQERDEESSKRPFHREHSIEDLLPAKNISPLVFNLAEPPGLSKSINYQKQTGGIGVYSAELSKRNSATTAASVQSPSNFMGGFSANNLKLSPQLPSFNCMNNALSPINSNVSPGSFNEITKNGTPNSASNFNVFAGEASRVLFVKGLEDNKLKVQVLYNLFSNFGNITKIIFMRNKGGALIEFQSVEYATIAKDFLNNLNFFSSYLRVFKFYGFLFTNLDF